MMDQVTKTERRCNLSSGAGAIRFIAAYNKLDFISAAHNIMYCAGLIGWALLLSSAALIVLDVLY